ncbi:BMP-binding endothelial regulator protein like [Argiope bruennichi]|uniref:BMP-binding endothelial regulator protein like n=1 Tax=Argiope bruennichi TaxID=94029 RepID=A0A8T0E5N9_ARGBR|nr:BMP-binding endothelial regulator protein like [Argiope bruennichi]
MGTMQYSFLVILALCAAAPWTPTGARVIHKRAAFYLANDTMCIVDGDVYRNGDPVPTDDECEKCTCRPPGFSCVLRDCDTKPGCKAVRRAGECCPEYVCGCVHNNRVYEDGEIIKDLQNNCYTCRCHGSSISCTFAECLFRGDCPPEYVPGECCPRYDHCPPLSTTSSSTIFTTVSTTPSKFVQQHEVFLNLTTQYLEKFTDEGTTLTVVDILPSSTTTTTTQAYSEETSTTAAVTVKFTLTDGPVTNITDLDLNTLTTLLPLQTSTYTETTKYIFPDENQSRRTTTQATILDVSDGSSSKEVLFSTETEESKEELLTSTTSVITESTMVTTPTPDASLVESTSEKIFEVHSSNEATTKITVTKNESVELDGSTEAELHFDETGDHSKTPADTVIIDSSTTSYESTQIFDGEKTDSEEESDSVSILPETSEDRVVHSSSTDKDDNLITETPEKTHVSSTTDELSLVTEFVKEEITLFPQSLHNVSGDYNATEFVSITTHTEESTEHEYESTKASTVVETHEPSSEFNEIFDGEEKLSTEKLDKLSVATDISDLSFETSTTEKTSETTLAEERTTIQSFNQPIDVQETTTKHISVTSQDEEKYVSVQQTKEKEETTSTKPTTELSSEINELFFESENKSHEISSTLQPLDIASSGESDVTEEWKKTTQHIDLIESQTSSIEDKQSTNVFSEYPTESEFSTELKNFTENPLSPPEINTEIEDLSTGMEAETSTIIPTSEITEKPLISDTPHVFEIESSEISHNDTSHDTLEENDASEDIHTSSDSHLLTILDSETSSSTDDTNFFGHSTESDTTIKEQKNTPTLSVEDHTFVETSPTELKLGVFTTNYETTTQKKAPDSSSDMIPETTSELALGGNKFSTETTKTDTSTYENISEASIADFSENSGTKTSTSNEILESTTSAIIENNKSTEYSFTENSGTKLGDLDYVSVFTTASNQNEGHSVFPNISESTEEEKDSIQNSETETISEISNGIKELTTIESVTDTVSNLSENEVATLMDQTEEVLESETLQSNFDTIVNNQQTTESVENFDNKISEITKESETSELVSDTTESVNVSTLQHVVSEDNNNTKSFADNSAVESARITEYESDHDVTTSSLKESDIDQTLEFSTSSTSDIITTMSPLLQDIKTKDIEVTKTTENQFHDSTSLSTDKDVIITKISVDAHSTTPISNESETDASDDFNNDLASTFSNNYEKFSTELKTSTVNSPSNDVPALILVDHENKETTFSTTITSGDSDFTSTEEQTGTVKQETKLETNDLELSPKLSSQKSTTLMNDEDYSALDSEENFSEEANKHSTHNVIQPSESEVETYTNFNETESLSPSESTFHQTKDNTLSIDEDLVSEENYLDVKGNVLQDSHSDEVNTATGFETDSEENSISSTIHPINNSYSTEEVHFIKEFTNTNPEDSESYSTNSENSENLQSDSTTSEQSSSNIRSTTISLEETSSNTKNDTFIVTDEFEVHTDEIPKKEVTLNEENFTHPDFQTTEENSHTQTHDSKPNENETLQVDDEDPISETESIESNHEIKDRFFANETASVNFNEGNSFTETLEGEESFSPENTFITEENVINFSNELSMPNHANEDVISDSSDILSLSSISSNDNPPFTLTSASNMNNIPEEAGTHTENNDGDNYSTSNTEILVGQSYSESSSENPVSNFGTPDTSAMTENKENESTEEFSTIDENTFGEAMHEYSDDHEKSDILKLTSTASQNTQTTTHDQTFDYHDIEMDSEEEATEFFNINITHPSVSYRVETARNLDDSTTLENLSFQNESNSLNLESLFEDKISSTQSDENNSNTSEVDEVNSDASINQTVGASYLHDDSKIFDEMGDHISGGNLYSAFVVPSDENLHKSKESQIQTMSGITESELYEVGKKNGTEHILPENKSNSTAFPKNPYEAYGYLGGVYITGNSKYNDHKKYSHELTHSPNDEINTVENKVNIETTENSSPVLDSERNAEKNNEEVSESEIESVNETTIKIEATVKPTIQYYNENNFGNAENLALQDQSRVTQINATENEVEMTTTEDYSINYNTSSVFPVNSNTTKEASEKHNYQISNENSKNENGPEKGGEWLEPTLQSSNAEVFLHSQSTNANENAKSSVEPDDYSTSSNTPEQNQKGPEKGGELFEPTISNPFHLDKKPEETESGDQSSYEKIELETESHSTTEKVKFASELPIYVLSRGKESSRPGALQFSSIEESDTKGSNISDIHLDYLASDIHFNYLNNSQVSDEENSRKEIPSFPNTVLNETIISFNDSHNLFAEPLNQTEKSNLNDSLLMSDESKENILQPYSLIDVISNVFKAPGYDSEVHSHFLKEQVNYSGKEEPLVIVKRNADAFQERMNFEKESPLKPDPNSKLNDDKINPHVLQTKKTIYDAISAASSTNSKRQDPPPAKVTSAFIFVVSPNDHNSGADKPSSSSSGSAQEIEFPNDNMFSQNNAQKTKY